MPVPSVRPALVIPTSPARLVLPVPSVRPGAPATSLVQPIRVRLLLAQGCLALPPELREASGSMSAHGDAPMPETASALACASPASSVAERSGGAGSVRAPRSCNSPVACPFGGAGSVRAPRGSCDELGPIHSGASSSGAGLPCSSPVLGPATPPECAVGPPRTCGKSLLATSAMADLAVRALAAMHEANLDDVCSFL